MMIESVIIWTNGMVIVFDLSGQQVPELQGPFGKVAEKISEQLHKQTDLGNVKIKFGKWNEAVLDIDSVQSFDRLWKKEE